MVFYQRRGLKLIGSVSSMFGVLQFKFKNSFLFAIAAIVITRYALQKKVISGHIFPQNT